MATAKKRVVKMTYRTEAEAREETADGTPIFCAYDELVDINALRPNPMNPNTHPDDQIKKLAAIISGTGWRAPITVSRQSGLIVRGHGRRLAAIRLGLSEVPVEYQEYANEAEEQADLIADNRVSEMASIDIGKLTDALAELDAGVIPIELTGFDMSDIESILGALAGEGNTEDDGADTEAAAADRTEPVYSKHGDLWLLGSHRLLCGDSTKKESYETLMAGESAQVVYTDPPYGVSYQSPSGNWEEIRGDDLRDDALMRDLLIPALRHAVAAATDDAAFYIWHASSTRRDFEDAMKAVGLLEKQYLIWAKNGIVPSYLDYQYSHEPCFYAEKAAGKPARFFGDRTNSTVWRVTRRAADELGTTITGGLVVTDGAGSKMFLTDKPPKGKKYRYIRIGQGKPLYLFSDSKTSTLWDVGRESKTIHPTQKPVELATRAIENSSERSDIILDIFAGSGGTIVAAELAGRRGYAIELDPRYVDRIVRRFIDLGKRRTVTLIRDGHEVSARDILPPDWFDDGATPVGQNEDE